jgi:4-carboxymuconolactone decarboxylase
MRNSPQLPITQTLEENAMSDLTPRERELVALGAAMGSNCVPCVEYHIPESRKVGLTDLEIHAAIEYADKVRQVPARKTLQAALKLLSSVAADVRTGGAGESCGCEASTDDQKKEASQTAQPCNMMMRMMSKMMNTCGSHSQSVGVPIFTEKKPAGNPVKNEGCGCG